MHAYKGGKEVGCVMLCVLWVGRLLVRVDPAAYAV